jgi:hypothetical protein
VAAIFEDLVPGFFQQAPFLPENNFLPARLLICVLNEKNLHEVGTGCNWVRHSTPREGRELKSSAVHFCNA